MKYMTLILEKWVTIESVVDNFGKQKEITIFMFKHDKALDKDNNLGYVTYKLYNNRLSGPTPLQLTAPLQNGFTEEGYQGLDNYFKRCVKEVIVADSIQESEETSETTPLLWSKPMSIRKAYGKAEESRQVKEEEKSEPTSRSEMANHIFND
jgi:hypothetical protein